MAGLVEGWNARDGGRVAEAFAADGVRVEYPQPGARLEGRAAIAAQAGAYIGALPDCVLDVRGVWRDGDTVTLEWTFSGTHTGDAPGFPADGKSIRLEGVSVCTMADGLIREERVYWDGRALQPD
jgi:steroid delta-isomerase-like uncharacterized protein